MPSAGSVRKRLLRLAQTAAPAAQEQASGRRRNGSRIVFWRTAGGTVHDGFRLLYKGRARKSGDGLCGGAADARTAAYGDSAEEICAPDDGCTRDASQPKFAQGNNVGECAAGQVIVGDITYLPLRSGKWCYAGSLAGQGNAAECRLAASRDDDGRIGQRGVAPGD